MSNPRNLTQFAFAAGIDESQQAEVLDPTAGFTRLENVRQDRRGAVSKRLGYDYLLTTRLDATSRTAGRKLLSAGDRVCTIDGTHIDVYSETLSRWTTVARVPEASYRVLSAPSSSGTGSLVEDVAYCNGIVVMALEDSWGGPGVAAVLDEDGTILRPPEAVDYCDHAYLGVYGTTVLLFCRQSPNVTAYYLDTSTAAGITAGWVSVGNVVTDLDAGIFQPVSVCSLTNRVAIAYHNSSVGTDQLTVKTVTSAGVVETRTVNTSSSAIRSCAVDGSIADTLWVAWNETTSVKVIGLDADSLASTLATTATVLTTSSSVSTETGVNVVASATAGAGRVFVDDGTETHMHARNFVTTLGAVATSGPQNTTYNAKLASRPFLYSGRYYALAYGGGDGTVLSNTHALCVLCDVTDNESTLRPVVNVEPGLVDLTDTPRQHIVATSVSGRYLLGLGLVRTASVRAASLVEVDFTATTRWQPVEHAGSTFLTGGATVKFDGSRLQDPGFIVKPSKPEFTENGTGLSPAVGYQWVAVYSKVDGDGNWSPSGVSTPSTSTGARANKAFDVTTRPCTITNRTQVDAGDADRVEFYRTLDGGRVYYLTGTVINDTFASVLTYNDANTDEQIAANARLYGTGSLPGTNGAGQDRRAPPGFSCLVSYNDMLVGATGSTLWHSSQSVVGEGVWFNPLFRLDMVDGGEVTALAAQDGTLFVFKRRSIFAVNGEPPADNGASGGLGTPRRLACDVGCVDPRSVVVTSLGVFFQSERGLELLTRGQSVEWIGEQVQTTLGSYPVITSATLDSAAALVRFTCAASETANVVSDTGVHLVFDLTLRTWVSVDKVSIAAYASRAAQSACMVYVGGAWRYAWLDKDGTVYREELPTSGTAYLDAQTFWITMLAESAWLKLGGIQGNHLLERALVLARKSTRADLSFSLAYDYSGTYETAATWTATVLDGLTTDIGRIQVAHGVHDEAEGVAVRVLLSDATPTGGTVSTGKGATWIGLSFQGTAREGGTNLPDEAR